MLNPLIIILYNIFLVFYRFGIRVAALFNPKAKKWVAGREHIFAKLELAIPKNEKVIWMHCASLGEFEQGRPILERLRSTYPSFKILLTFFSPSGYDAQKNYSGADWVFYLPLDGQRNARRFLTIVHPALVIFIKYELWYYYLKKISSQKIPLLLVSAIFRKETAFFKWYGGLQRKMLTHFNHIFVQNKLSQRFLERLELPLQTTVAGDTRYDRVAEIANFGDSIEAIDSFVSNNPVIVAGSTWPSDEMVLQKSWEQLPSTLKLIIAPHEIDKKNIDRLVKDFPTAILYSTLQKTRHVAGENNVLIIDCIGMLSRLYRYATITYVGGGLDHTGVHNVLEAAVYAKPVLFGNNYKAYAEAVGLIEAGGAFPFVDDKKDGQSLQKLVNALMVNDSKYLAACKAAGEFVIENTGATKIVLDYIHANRLLTN